MICLDSGGYHGQVPGRVAVRSGIGPGVGTELAQQDGRGGEDDTGDQRRGAKEEAQNGTPGAHRRAIRSSSWTLYPRTTGVYVEID